jgi:hypothetical protein
VLEILRHLFPRNQNLTVSCTRIYCKTQEENLLCSLTDGTFSSPLSSRLQQGAGTHHVVSHRFSFGKPKTPRTL